MERRFISQFLDSVLSQDYPKDSLEVIIADGNSTDGTREVILRCIDKTKFIKLIDNPLKNQTIALNKACRISRGEIIVRLDVHANYPVDYISSLVSAQQRLHAWNVGCPWVTMPSDNTAESFVIASVLSSPFGVGNALYRIGTKKEKLVDTVPFGCFPKDVLVKLDYYNEQFLKNEDDELNARIVKAGGTIYLLQYPVVTYFARETNLKLFKMLFQYGYYKPFVNYSVGSIISLRQLFPPAFVVYCCIIPSLLLFDILYPIIIFFLIPFIIYLLLLLIFSFKTAFGLNHKFKKTAVFFLAIISFAGMHFSYGFGYIRGFINLLLGAKSKSQKLENITR